jgi:hypothetical protein
MNYCFTIRCWFRKLHQFSSMLEQISLENTMISTLLTCGIVWKNHGLTVPTCETVRKHISSNGAHLWNCQKTHWFQRCPSVKLLENTMAPPLSTREIVRKKSWFQRCPPVKVFENTMVPAVFYSSCGCNGAHLCSSFTRHACIGGHLCKSFTRHGCNGAHLCSSFTRHGCTVPTFGE